MNQSNVNVEEWVEMFRAIGLDDQQMSIWHQEFERRHPDAHEGFLRWLGLPTDRIQDIRAGAGSDS
ncbi:MAG: hypothetical protein ACR2QW_19350 [bacterium]